MSGGCSSKYLATREVRSKTFLNAQLFQDGKLVTRAEISSLLLDSWVQLFFRGSLVPRACLSLRLTPRLPTPNTLATKSEGLK